MRVSLLLDDQSLKEWQRLAVERMIRDCNAEITLLIINEKSKTHKERYRANPVSLETAGLLARSAKFRLFGKENYRSERNISDIDWLANVPIKSTTPEPAETFGNQLSPDVVREVNQNSDIAVRFGFGILKGSILTGPEYGVLSYHHGDIRRYRGRPSGFQEFMDGVDTVGVTLQRLSEEIDAGEIVAFTNVDVSDAWTYQEYRRRMFLNSVPLLAEGVKNLEDPDFTIESPSELGPLRTLPDAAEVFRYVIKNTAGRIRRWYR